MPIYDPEHVEYGITTGSIQVVMEGGRSLPAYWAHPVSGRRLPAVALIHDWWGITPIIRRMANLFAQTGYYVIAPDLFDGQIAATPLEAMERVKALGEGGFARVNAALSVLETHHNTNGDVAAVGVGLGGGLAFEAAITRPDLEAAVAYGGFPQRCLGRFGQAQAPILAFYGADEPYIPRAIIDRLRAELAAAPLAHEVVILMGIGHEFFTEDASEAQRQAGRQALARTFAFLEAHLQPPARLEPRMVY